MRCRFCFPQSLSLTPAVPTLLTKFPGGGLHTSVQTFLAAISRSRFLIGIIGQDLKISGTKSLYRLCSLQMYLCCSHRYFSFEGARKLCADGVWHSCLRLLRL